MEQQPPGPGLPPDLSPAAGPLTLPNPPALPRPAAPPAPGGAFFWPTTGLRPQGGGSECSCGASASAGPLGFVYAIGTITARFPNQSIEREFLQVWGKTNYSGPISNTALYEVLSQGQNLYLARNMCWVFQNESVDMYLLQPRSQVELADLISALNDPPGQITFDMIVGLRGPVAPPSMCNGLQLPLAVCDQVFTFTYDQFIQNIIDYAAKLGKTVAKEAAQNAFNVLSQLADNSGQSDEHRAVNYITFRSLDVYIKETEMEKDKFRVTAVTAQPSRLGGTRSIVDVIFVYTNTVSSEVQQYFTRVDVTGEFPFLVTSIARFYDRP